MRKRKIVFETRTLVCPAGGHPFRIRADEILFEEGWDAAKLFAVISRAEDAGLVPVTAWLRREIAGITASPPALGGPGIAAKLADHIWSSLYRKMHAVLFPYLQIETTMQDGSTYSVHVPDGFVEALCRRLTARATNDRQGLCADGVPEAFLRYLGRAKWRFAFMARNPETGEWETAVPTSRTASEAGTVWLMRRTVCFPVLTFEPAGSELHPRNVLNAADPLSVAANVLYWHRTMFTECAGLSRERTSRRTVLDWDTLCEPQWLDFLRAAPVDLSPALNRDEESACRLILAEIIAKTPLKPTPARHRTTEQLSDMSGFADYRDTMHWIRTGERTGAAVASPKPSSARGLSDRV